MEAFVEELESYGIQVCVIEGDISRPETAKELINTAILKFGKIDTKLIF